MSSAQSPSASLQQRKHSRLRRLSVGLCVSLVSLLATLCLLEIAVRVFMPQDPKFWDERTVRQAEATPPHFLENIPHAYNRNYIGVPVSINSYGLRGDEIEVPKPANTFRIVGVGDSITFGYGIRLEDTFLKILEKRLNESASAETRYEVLNAGVEGTGLDYYYHFVSERAPALQPDMILIGLCLNDIADYSRAGAGSEGGSPQQKQPLTRKISNFLLEHSQLYMASYMQLKSALYGLGILDINKLQGYNFLPLEPPSAAQARAWDSSLRILSKLADFSRDHGCRLVVVVFPMEMQLSPATLQLYRDRYHIRIGDEPIAGVPQSRLKEIGAADEFTVVDLLPAFRAANSADLFLKNKAIRSDPVHPSVQGNLITAQEIYRVLQTSELRTGKVLPDLRQITPARQIRPSSGARGR